MYNIDQNKYRNRLIIWELFYYSDERIYNNGCLTTTMQTVDFAQKGILAVI